MTTYQIREGKPQIGYYTDNKVTVDEYRAMAQYQRQKHRLRKIRQYQG